jgi:peptidoglycan/LPS O-acetylase OafA/YrhL
LRWPVLRSFGKYSYAIYLFHFIIIELILRLQGRFRPHVFAVLALIVGLSLSYGLAWLSWKWLEYPCLRLKRFFPHPKQVRPPEPVVV